ncbi:hypothetical protein V2O64_17025 [Verrucomicrobiaceae bacterium 227]
MNAITSLFASTLLVSSLVFTSCGGPSVGDQLTAQGEGPASALGQEWKRADKMIAKGKDNQSDGKKMVKKGNKLIEEGNEQLQAGERLKAETELAATRAGYLKGSQ